MNGGPALHVEDEKLYRENVFGRESLITVRKGEPVRSPENYRLTWCENEIIKLKGKAGQWTCSFYTEKTGSCSIYNRRPLECELLKCWDTEELQSVINRNLINRFDLIAPDEPIIDLIIQHENQCDLEYLSRLEQFQAGTIPDKLLAELNELVNKDLDLRSEAIKKYNLNVDLEVFYFGRPVFKILSQFDLLPREINNKVILIQT